MIHKTSYPVDYMSVTQYLNEKVTNFYFLFFGVRLFYLILLKDVNLFVGSEVKVFMV